MDRTTRLILPDQYSTRKNPSGHAASLQNTIRAVAELGIKSRYDVFHNKIVFEGHPSLDADFENVCLVVRQLIAQQKEFEPSKDTMHDAVTRIALEYQFNPIIDYLDGLKWDGQKRIDTWLTVYLGADDTPLHRAMGRKWLLAAVRRVRLPGCKFDNIPTLEGPQGSLKSTLVREMAGGRENFSDADILQSDKREQQELCEGVWFYEIAELSGLHKGEVEKVKAFASRQEDKARPAYARRVSVRPRTCVFVGTTNDDEYLQDQTGNRRFWPIRIGRIDIEAFRRDRDQLFAEAAVGEATGESLVLPEELRADAAALQDSRVVSDPWADRLGMFREKDDLIKFAPMSGGNVEQVTNAEGELVWRVTSEFILTAVLKIAPDRQNNAQFQEGRSDHAEVGLEESRLSISRKDVQRL
jgi:predicted P-loop ATPase